MSPDLSLTSTPFGWPVITYMTLAGVASGACLIGCLGLLSTKQRFQSLGRQALLVVVVSIVLGAGFLVLDLEAPSRFWFILTYFNPSSVIAWGARATVVFGLLCAFVWLVGYPQEVSSQSNRLSSSGFKALLIVLIFLAVTVGLYPAFVLRQAVARPLWTNPVIAPLFFTSGLHTGITALALLAIVRPLNSGKGSEGWTDDDLRNARRVDAFLIFVQAALLFAFLSLSNTAPPQAIARLTTGALSAWLWAGIIFVGWLLPLVQMIVIADRGWGVAARGICILVGGFSLRAFIILGGQGSIAFFGSQV